MRHYRKLHNDYIITFKSLAEQRVLAEATAAVRRLRPYAQRYPRASELALAIPTALSADVLETLLELLRDHDAASEDPRMVEMRQVLVQLQGALR